ncbi:MAG TPA: hypothetical protein PKM58_11740, partial [Pyrinomonadaceae bacterium]|nr:hypothetical protein [Pyrinomonadaceae bacterium]
FARFVLSEFGVRAVCITRAEHGCLLVGRDETIELPGIAVKVVDAVKQAGAEPIGLQLDDLR